MDVQPLTTYRLDVVRNDGRSTSTMAATPNVANFSFSPTGQDCVTPIHFEWEPVNPKTFIELRIFFEFQQEQYFFNDTLDPAKVDNFDGKLSFSITPQKILFEVICNGVIEGCRLPESPPGGPAACYLLTTNMLKAKYFHYGPNYSGEATVDTSFTIPGGIGNFFGVFIGSHTFPIDTSKL